MRAEDGNEAYEYYIPLDDSETVFSIGRWRDQDGIDAHHASPMMTTIAKLRDRYDPHMEVRRLSDPDSPDADAEFVRY